MRPFTVNRLHLAIALTTVTTLSSFTIASDRAQALNLNPGDTIPLAGTTFAAEPDLGGVVLEDVLRTINIGRQEVTLQDRVVRSTNTGTLDFYYAIRNNSANVVPILDLLVQRSSFAGFSTDVNFRLDGLGTVSPINASRTADGKTVSFLFNGNAVLPPATQTASGLLPGMTRFFYVKTNATTYDALGTGSIDDSQFVTFQPTAVPTPALLPCLVGVGLTLWRKRRAAEV
jgi:hypothetical protein